MSTFAPNRALLNPKFDGYKLAPLTHDQVASHYPLQYKISQTNVSGRAPLSFKEVQSRVFHNHLAVSHRVAYVDAELRVIAIDIDKVTLVPSFRVLYELPKPIQSSAVETPQREYPSAAFVDDTSLFISDGCGNLYALRLTDTGAAELLSVFELSIPPAYASARSSVPFRIHDAVQVATGAAVVILSSKHYPEISPDPSQSRSKSPPYTQLLDIIWHRRGDDVPVYTVYDASRGAFMLVGSSSFQPIEVAAPVSYEPSSDEIAPIPRQGESIDTDTQLKKPPPYSWTQTSDSVTVAIPSHPLRRQGATDAGDIPIVAPRYTLKKLWDGIKASTSLWTFDRAAEHTYGMLSLHLEKQHEGTRWAHVFSSAGTGEDEEVPETLDPTELYAIRDVLENTPPLCAAGRMQAGSGSGGACRVLQRVSVTTR
ncbi:NudC domain-containing protein 1 [Grifola frondosa]|uniref:NudC domain-containing protein 1 n=1 Tax=Grifola frondosa TaxID=5627 RepID=A0A1C7LWE2_GRIFR|nr:NudC domain-containing protein 1 [Grifola frondosa]